MPQRSDRAEQLRDLEGEFILSILCDNGPNVSSDSSSSGSSISSPSSAFDSEDEMDLDDDKDWHHEGDLSRSLCDLYTLANSIRYFKARGISMKTKEFAERFYSDILTSADFRQVTRMSKTSFWTLVTLIEEHPVFCSLSRRKQACVSYQLGVTLDRLGHHGNGSALRRSGLLWGVSNGTIHVFMRRCFTALEDALADAVSWPDEQERTSISAAFALKGFPGCVGLVDGTLLPLSQRPKNDGECYFDRKKRYSVNMQIVCDHRRKILHAYAGMPGASGDVASIQKSPLWTFRNDSRAFSNGEYLLGDSGYLGLLPHIVAAYKYSVAAVDCDKDDFNLCVAKTRVTNEHCIGELKSRWHSLKEQKTQLKDPSTSKWMMRQVECCVRLHNYVLDMKDEWTDEDQTIIIEQDDSNLYDTGCDTDNTSLRDGVMAQCLQMNRRAGGFLA